jgi:hypothetical protein
VDAVPKFIRPVEYHLIEQSDLFDDQIKAAGPATIRAMAASGAVRFAEARYLCLRAWAMAHRLSYHAWGLLDPNYGPDRSNEEAQDERRQSLIEAIISFNNNLETFEIECDWRCTKSHWIASRTPTLLRQPPMLCSPMRTLIASSPAPIGGLS